MYDIHMSNLVRKNFYITASDNAFLKNIDDRTASEHMRIAISEYVAKHKRKHQAILSPKGGDYAKSSTPDF